MYYASARKTGANLSGNLNEYYENNVEMNRGNTKKTISIVMPIINDILTRINKKDDRFSAQPACTGSYYQGLKVNRADEFDINVPIQGADFDNYREWTEYSPINISVFGNRIVRTSVPHEAPPLGYCQINMDQPSVSWRNDDVGVDGVILPFLTKNHFKALFTEAIDKAGYAGIIKLTSWRKGPALTITIKYPDHHPISVDFAPIIVCPNLPLPSYVIWPRQGTMWPSYEKNQTLKRMGSGLQLVAKSDLFWHISFGHMEEELLRNIDEDGGCRKRLQRIIKRLRDEVWCQGKEPIVSSYHLKNILFWECEAHPWRHEWTQDMQAVRFLSMVKRLLTALRKQELPQFFLPQVNLLQNSGDPELYNQKLRDAVRNIEAFLRNPSRYLR